MGTWMVWVVWVVWVAWVAWVAWAAWAWVAWAWVAWTSAEMVWILTMTTTPILATSTRVRYRRWKVMTARLCDELAGRHLGLSTPFLGLSTPISFIRSSFSV